MRAGIVLEGQFDKNYDQLRLGFFKGSNPTAFKRLASFATLNAARTLKKPIKDAAPRGETGNLKKKITARKARFNRPAAVVGIKGGRNGVFYGWLVVGGQGTRRTTKNGTSEFGKKKKTLTIATVTQNDIYKLQKENINKADFIICTPENMTKTH